MNDQLSLNKIDSLICQYALQTRELSKEKNVLNEQIKVCRADIAEKRSHKETLVTNIKKLEADTRLKQSSVMHNHSMAKSMKATNSLLLQYEQTLRAELESKKASYNHDMEVYEERIANYSEVFQSHREYYYQTPLAQKLLRLQAEKVEIECRIKACDNQITMKQTELDHLNASTDTGCAEKIPDRVCHQQLMDESQQQSDSQTEDSESVMDSFCLQLSQTQMLQRIPEGSVEESTADISEVLDTTSCSSQPEDAGSELMSQQQPGEQGWADEMQTNEEREKEIDPRNQSSDHQADVSELAETIEDKTERGEVLGEDETLKKSSDGLTDFSQLSSQENNLSSLRLAKITSTPSTSGFPFSFSPHEGNSDTKSPGFQFTLNSEPGTPNFPGFGFDQAEDTSFTFSGSFFNEKKSTESKSSDAPEFLFNQPDHGEDFPFAFNFKSPQPSSKEKGREDFPFSFSF